MLSTLAYGFGKRCMMGRSNVTLRLQRTLTEAASLAEKRAARAAKREAFKAKLAAEGAPRQAKGQAAAAATGRLGAGARLALGVLGAGAAAAGAGWALEGGAAERLLGAEHPLLAAYRGSPAESVCRAAAAKIDELFVQPFAKPSFEKLLPDWPMPGIPPDTPQPLVLVLDLEDTLVRTHWDRKGGWRYAKRPGVDRFLFDLCRYYEIVIFSPSMAGIAEEVITALDPENYVMHRLYRDATHYVKGTHVKDLSKLNRPLEKILIIDDDPECFQLQPENGICIRPYLDATDKHDTALEDLKPFLEQLAIEHLNKNIKSVPKVLEAYGTRAAEELVEEHKRRVQRKKAEVYEKGRRGLGGLVRGRGAFPGMAAPAAGAGGGLSGPTAADIVAKGPGAGAAEEEAAAGRPAPAPKKGRLWQRYADKAKEAEEEQQRKNEAWQKVMQKKELERMKREAGRSSS